MNDELRMGLVYLLILCGDEIGPSGAVWQQISGICASPDECLTDECLAAEIAMDYQAKREAL